MGESNEKKLGKEKLTTTFLHPTVPQLIYLSHLIAKIANWDSSWYFCFKYVLIGMIL